MGGTEKQFSTGSILVHNDPRARFVISKETLSKGIFVLTLTMAVAENPVNLVGEFTNQYKLYPGIKSLNSETLGVFSGILIFISPVIIK